MLNRIYTSANGSFYSLGAMRMHSHPETIILGRFNDGLYLFFGKLRIASTCGDTQHATRGSNFYKISSIFISLADGLSTFIRPVSNAFCRAWVTHEIFTVTICWIGMAAGRCN